MQIELHHVKHLGLDFIYGLRTFFLYDIIIDDKEGNPFQI